MLSTDKFETGRDVTLLLLRVLIGAFLVWGVWDNIVSADRMAEFEAFLTQFNFPAPAFMARLSVWAQFVCGVFLIVGFLTRAAAAVMAFNFLVAFFMVHLNDDFRAQFPSLVLIVVSLHLIAAGPGVYSLHSVLARRR